jgi:uncharacterized membrane protein
MFYIAGKGKAMDEERKALLSRFGKKLRAQFLAGIFVVVPVGASILILIWVFSSIDNILQPIIEAIFGNPVPGVGFAVTLVIIYLTGVIASNVVGKRMVRYSDYLLSRVPVFRQLYNGIKRIMESFAISDKMGITHVVLIEFPRQGMKSIGFITNEFTDQSGEKLLNVLIPTAPNPTSGFLQIVKESDVVRTKISIDDALKMIVSIGSTIPSDLEEKSFVMQPGQDDLHSNTE